MANSISHLLILLQADSVLLKHDKVYSILAVILVIFFAILFMLWRTDRKASQLEKKIEDLENS